MNMKIKFFLLLVVLFVSGCLTCVPKIDFSTCENATTDIAKSNCYAAGMDKVECMSTCDGIPDEYWRDRCYLNLAKNQKSVKICENIQNKNILKECVEEVY